MRKIRGEDIALWPDGAWCYFEEIGEMAHRSDDYEIIAVENPRWELIANGEMV